MFRIAVAGVRVRRLRSLLLAATIMLGLSILGSSVIYADSASAAFFDDLARGAVGVDVVVRQEMGGHEPNEQTAATLARLPGVDHVDLRSVNHLALLGHTGRVISNDGDVGLAVPAPSWDGFAPYRITGRSPQRSGEVAVDQPSAEREGIRIGDSVTVLDQLGTRRVLTVVGLADFGVSKYYADQSVVVLTPTDLTAYVGPRSGDVVVAARPGIDQALLRQRIAATLGSGYLVRSGDDLRTEIADDSAKYVDSFLKTLRATSIVALAVALLVVYNAFRIMVAQRVREHALMRTLGASRRQVASVMVAESLLIGAVASVGSVLLSAGGAYLLLTGQRLIGHGIPPFHLVITPLAVAGPIVAGLAVSVVSVAAPALSAGRASPMAALRDAAAPPVPGGRSVSRTVLAVGGGLVAAAAGFVILNSGRGKGFDGLVRLAAGGVIVFAVMILLLPLFITPLTGPLRILFGRFFGPSGRLAVDNTRRHPARFAAATAALVIGIAPMTAFAVLLTTARIQGSRELAENFPVDFVVSHANHGAVTAFDPAVVTRLRSDRDFEVVALSRVATANAGGSQASIGTAEPGVLGGTLAVEVREGTLGGLGPGTAAVSVPFATAHNVGIGQTLTVGSGDRTWPARVVATYENTPVDAEVLVNWADYGAARLTGAESILVRRAGTTSAADARASLESQLAGDALAVVSSSADRREALADSLGRRLVQFNVLLGLSMVIAVLGVGNTLSLSVVERTRETGMLRAAGLSRRQTYRMLLVEALLMAIVASLLGVAYGLGFGWLLARQLIASYGHGAPGIPFGTISAYIGLTGLAAGVASLLPARRAARASIVSAIEEH